MGSCEDFVLTTVDEPGCVQTTLPNSGLWEDDVSPEVLVVLDLVECCRLCRLGVTSGGKGGFNANIRERWGK